MISIQYMYKVIRQDDWGEKERKKERAKDREANSTKDERKKKQQTTRTRINDLSYYFHYGYNEVLMARRTDGPVSGGDYVGTGRHAGERGKKGGNERPTQTDGDGRIEKNHLATGHYNNT